MNKTSILPIVGVRSAESVLPSNPRLPMQDGNRESLSVAPEKPAQPARNEAAPVGNLLDISIHFNVDDETGQLIVVVVERASGRVLRAIPASELQKLRVGELLKRTA